MHHCQKIRGGKGPPVNTQEEWRSLHREVKLSSSMPIKGFAFFLWLSATKGGRFQGLERLPRWPKTETVNKKTIPMAAMKTVWRDFYTGQRLDNATNSFIQKRGISDTEHCAVGIIYTSEPILQASEIECIDTENLFRSISCSCMYPAQPFLSLRGLCKDSLIAQRSPSEIKLFTPQQLHTSRKSQHDDITFVIKSISASSS